jgi:hypothetical protein
MIEKDPEPIHGWFGLTYSSYLVLPRTVLQSMPVEWQERFVDLLEELGEAMTKAGIEQPAGYWVRPTDGKRFIKETLPHYRHAPNVLERT